MSLRRALVLACVAFASMRAIAGAVVEVRGGGVPLEAQVRSLGAAGLEVRSTQSGVDSTQVLPWSQVRAVREEPLDAQAQRWLAAGEGLWRARIRIARGDWSLAQEPLSRAAEAWRGAAPSEDGLAAAAFEAEAMLRAGRVADAVIPAFETLRLLRVPIAPGAGVAIPARVADVAALLPAGIAPMSVPPADAPRVAQALRAMDLSQDGALRAVANAFAAVLEAPAEEAAATPETNAAARPALAALEALRQASGTDSKTRAAGRAALAKLRRSMPAWFEAWARCAAGASLAAEDDSVQRERGLVLLLSVVACDAGEQPWLALRARAIAAQVLTAAREGAAATRVAAAELPGAAMQAGATSARGSGAAAGAPGVVLSRADDAVPRELSDTTGALLQRLGLDALLLAHLEAQLEAEADQEARTALVNRLAALLSARLEREDDPAGRDAMLARSMKLINRYDEGSEQLRLAVLRSQHRAAQRAAEDRRAGRADDATARAAQQQFDQLVKDFTQLSARTGRARERTDREVGRSSGTTAEDLAARSATEEEISRSAQFFRAWAQYYSAWLGRELGDPKWRERADSAMAWFAALIEPGKVAVDPADVSVDLRGNEGFASAILGTALTASLTQSGATADAWLALLETPGTHASVRAKLPAWKMASLLDRGDDRAALALLEREGNGAQGIPMALIAAARSVRRPGAPGAAELLTEAVGQLAAAGRLRDLAMIDAASASAQSGGTPAGTPGATPEGASEPISGAGAALLAGVRAAAQAQRAQSSGDAVAAKEAWIRAADALARAAAPGAPAAVAAGARSLQAWALRGAGRSAEAAEAFLASARALTGERAADAMWMAVLAFDEASRGGSGDAMAVRADETAALLIQQSPESSGAVRARAWRIVRSATPALADIDALLGDRVPPELAPAARRAAFEGLYRRFRTLTGDERTASARRALAAGDNQPMGAGEEGTLELRRRIELALALDDRVRAAEALDAVLARVSSDPTLSRELAAELGARRAQVAALDGRLDEARAAAETLDAASPWGTLAWQSLLAAVLRDPAASPAARAAAARSVVMATNRPAEAETVMWARANAQLARAGERMVDPAGCTTALDRALLQSPRSLALLLVDAELCVLRGDTASAIERARTALAMVAVPSPEWFEAKATQVEALAVNDQAQARAVLDQVRQLGGGFGSGATALRLLALDQSLPRSTATGGAR